MKLGDLELAFEMVSGSPGFQVLAYVHKGTHVIVYDDEEESGVECPVSDIEFDPDYLSIPTRRDLDLGQPLVWEFVEREAPGLRDKISWIFRRKGAYPRYKAFLRECGLLDKWHAFESTRTREGLLEWCRENGIEVTE